MRIPDFQTLMRPLLELHADGQEKSQPDLRAALARRFRLTDEELAERLPSGTQTTFANRVGWASTYMKEAGLLVKPRRGISQITERGLSMLREYPEGIDMTALEQFPEYLQFHARGSGRRRTSQPSQASIDVLTRTPEEAIEAGYLEIREALASELVGRLVARDDRFFEDVVLDVLVAVGYGGSRDASERVGRSGDGGIDGVIRQDRLGLDKVYVQAKKWARDRTVGPREIREFLGALQDVAAAKGVFITTSGFSSEARDLAQRRNVVLIDGLGLAELMVDFGVGVTTLKTYQLRRIDEDYFGEAE